MSDEGLPPSFEDIENWQPEGVQVATTRLEADEVICFDCNRGIMTRETCLEDRRWGHNYWGRRSCKRCGGTGMVCKRINDHKPDCKQVNGHGDS